jgi:hypothetical protein
LFIVILGVLAHEHKEDHHKHEHTHGHDHHHHEHDCCCLGEIFNAIIGLGKCK